MRKKSVTVKQIQRLDQVAIKKYGVPSLALMENAGCSVSIEIIKVVRKIKRPRICIVCGLGNNAGDGFVAARHLMNAGIQVSIFLVGRGKQLKGDAAVNYKILKKIRHPIKEITNKRGYFLQSVKKADIIIDAIFGVGLNRQIKDPFKWVIETLNQSRVKILSVDTPSGLDGTTGKIYGTCIKANTTVTFTFAKKGFLKSQGPTYTGKIIVADIGIPVALQKRVK